MVDEIDQGEDLARLIDRAHYFPRWLKEAGVMEFLDFLLADSGTTPVARQRAEDLRDRLAHSGSAWRLLARTSASPLT